MDFGYLLFVGEKCRFSNAFMTKTIETDLDSIETEKKGGPDTIHPSERKSTKEDSQPKATEMEGIEGNKIGRSLTDMKWIENHGALEKKGMRAAS